MIYTIYIEKRKEKQKQMRNKKKCIGPIHVWLIKIGCPAINIV